MWKQSINWVLLLAIALSSGGAVAAALDWQELPPLPNPAGVAGPFTGVHGDALIVAGGANFPKPVWESQKVWHDDIWVLLRTNTNGETTYQWREGGKLERPIAYGASVSTPDGVVCIGGNDGVHTYTDVFLMLWNAEKGQVEKKALPSLPAPCAYGSAVFLDGSIYVLGGTTGLDLETAQRTCWSMEFSDLETEKLSWKKFPSWPGTERALAIAATQHNGVHDCIYLISGRCENEAGDVLFLKDVYEFCPATYRADAFDADTGVYTGAVEPWRRRADIPRCVMAGTGIDVGQSHIFVLGGADGSLFYKGDVLKDDHPGFPKEAWAYHTITNTWTSAGAMPANQVTTTAVRWGSDSVHDPIIIPSGEVRPRVRSPKVWQIRPVQSSESFGWVDFSVLGLYLLAMIGVGVFFSFRNKNSDDFFRGGQRVPWFVAGLSIFATMLSSITFIAIPAKAYATDWVYFMVNMMVIAIAPFVIMLFLPFFRAIDATSAYEYLEKRFNRFARLFASASFVLFQIGRMAVVLYLPALALAAITPLSEQQCILLMGGLSIIYCALGGLEAVVWTDTVQSFVLLGGALLSLLLIVSQLEDGFSGFWTTALEQEKLHLINWDFSSHSYATTALWVVVLGGLAQSLVPYSSDMAVVQRYMSVPDIGRAKKGHLDERHCCFSGYAAFFRSWDGAVCFLHEASRSS